MDPERQPSLSFCTNRLPGRDSLSARFLFPTMSLIPLPWSGCTCAAISIVFILLLPRGDFGRDPSDVNAYAASSFYAADRFAGYKADWGPFYEEGGIIIADRYTTSNAIHQCSKLPEKEWDGFLEWLFHFEYELLGIPAPDEVIYLQVDPQISQELMTGATGEMRTKRTSTRGICSIWSSPRKQLLIARSTWGGA